MTITFLIPEITPSLRTYLTNSQGFTITTVDDGLNYIDDNAFSVQIIEQRKLSADKNLFFSSLTNQPTIKHWDTLLKEMANQGKPLKNNPLLEVLAQASPDDFMEVISMQTGSRYEEVMRELGERVGLGDVNAAITNKAKEIAKKMLNIGEDLEKIALLTDLDIETVKALR